MHGFGGCMEDDEIKKALLKKAVGYVSDEIVEEYVTDEKGNAILSKRKITKKYNPPDVSALRFLLEQDECDDYSNMTDEQLRTEKERLLQLLKEKEKENENANL